MRFRFVIPPANSLSIFKHKPKKTNSRTHYPKLIYAIAPRRSKDIQLFTHHTHTRKFVYILIVCKQPTKHTSFRGQRTIRVDTIRKGMEKEATSSKPLHTHRPHSFRRRQRASSEGQPSVLSQLLGRSIEHPTCLIYKCSPRTSGGDAAATRKCRALLFPQ